MSKVNLERYLIEFTLSKVQLSGVGVILLTLIASGHSYLVYDVPKLGLIFTALTLTLNFFRVWKAQNYTNEKIKLFDFHQIKKEIKTQALLAYASAFSFSLWTSFLMYNFGTKHPTFFITLIMVTGIASAGMVSFSAHVATYKKYVIFLFLSWFTQGLILNFDKHFLIIALTTVLFVVFLFKTSRIMNDAFLDQAKMSIQADTTAQLIKSYLESLPGFVSVLDENFNYVFESQNLEKNYGSSLSKRLGYKHPDSVFFKKVTAFAKSNHLKGEFITKISFDQNEERTCHFYLSKIIGDQKILCFAIDIEDKVQIENNLAKERIKLEHSSRLASLGEMAGGIAHEINNPLAIISGTLSLIPRYLNDEEKLQSKLLNIKNATDRILKIVNSMRVFSRKSDADDLPQKSIDCVIENIIPLTVENTRKNNIELSLKLNSTSQILIHEVSVGQILINLINNSVDAISGQEKPWIKIETQEMTQNTNYPYIEVRVTDSGYGIPIELRNKIMEPFFTTKSVGKGTGLGLSVAIKSAEHFGGKLELDENNSNTSFVLKIPMKSQNKAVAV
jgi:signal transduction histidine kinase